MPSFGKTSLRRLEDVHPELQRLFKEVVKDFDCTIVCGHRNAQDQRTAYVGGFSNAKFPESKHNSKPSMAVDVMPYHYDSPHIQWENTSELMLFGEYVMGCASRLGIEVEWGGLWETTFGGDKDYPHWQLKGGILVYEDDTKDI